MAEEYRMGYVFVQNNYAGVIAETDEGYEFIYDSEYLESEHPVAVSLTMPLREAAYKSANLFPFFDGLIPEGWLLSLVNHNWKISLNDRFGLLLVSCRDCIGDVQVRSEV